MDKVFFKLTEREKNSLICVIVFPLMEHNISVVTTVLQANSACHCIGFQLGIPTKKNEDKPTNNNNNNNNGADSKKNDNGLQHLLVKVIDRNCIILCGILKMCV